MSSIKDLFDIRIKTFQKQHETLQSASIGAESPQYVIQKQKVKEMYVPPIDFSTASNFAKYGSAELYYDFGFKRIYNHYPYDGTLAEKLKFETESTHLDRYIFEKLYPRTNGYINLGYQGFDGSKDGSGYNNATVKEYVFVFGSIHTASGGMTGKPIQSVFDKSNIYDVSNGAKKGASLEFKPVSGSTVEFWLKKDAFHSTLADKEVIFDFWNQEAEGSAGYGRLTLNINNSEDFVLTWRSGSTTDSKTISHASLDISDGKWHHYAVSFQNKNNKTKINFYQDGTLKKRTESGTTINEIKGVSKGLSATIGALNTAPFGVAGLERGDGKFSGSMDEFRYWKKARTPEEVGLDWFCQVGGGTNTHDANKELGIYFKFNEGITGTNQDAVVLDYSGRIANGTWTGYTSGARSTGSAMVISGIAKREFRDPIMYSYHPDVTAQHALYKATGSMQDYSNTSLFYNLLPSWICEQDKQQGEDLKYLSQILASYFDTAFAQISSMLKIRDKTYKTGSLGPNAIVNDVLRDRGLVMPNMFMDASLIEKFRSKDRNEIYEGDIQKVKNVIYQNIYNNLNYILKTKGTEKSYRNLFRCAGFDTELVKVNMYCDNSTLLVEDRYEFKSVVKPVIKFNAEDNMKGTVYQTSSSSGLTYISGSGDEMQYGALTLEAEFILPKKLESHETGHFYTDFLTCSVAGFHRPIETDSNNYAWHPGDLNLSIFAVRDVAESKHVRFILSGNLGGGNSVSLTSSLYRNAYDNQKWLLAARVKHESHPYAGVVTPDANTKNYIVEFYGINTNGSYIDNGPFLISGTIANDAGKKLLSRAKRIYAGAHRRNFTGSIVHKSDIHLSQVRYWQSYIDDETLKQHSFDSTNYGTKHSLRADSLFAVDNIQVPRGETLALHWDFGTVTGSDASGMFTFSDKSSGSAGTSNRYSHYGNIINTQHDGAGKFFPVSSFDAVDKATIYSAKRKPAEVAYSSDGVKIVGKDQEAFFQDDDRNDIYFSFEKSPYGAISDEMINFFATVKDFSNFVGLPVNRFRHSYKQADYMRQMFFERVPNIPDPERYFEYFKWIDESISYAIEQLLPASTRTGDSIKNIVESHILERNKFREKFPFTGKRISDLESTLIGAEGSLVNWAISHAPQPQSPIPNDIHCVWQKTRRNFSEPEPQPSPIVAPGIDTLRRIINERNIRKGPTLVNNDTGKNYVGSTYAIRNINRPYVFGAVMKNTIHSGVNYFVAKRRNFVHDTVHPHGPVNSNGIPVNVMVVGVGEGQGLVNQVKCDDATDPRVKNKYDFHAFLGENTQGTTALSPLSSQNDYNHQVKGIMAFPLNFVSKSVDGGYARNVNQKFKSKLVIANLHSDTIDITNDVPMQSPFTEQHVGGHQSRHIAINKFDTTLIDDETGVAPTNNIDNLYTRPEAWRILIGEHSSSTHQDGALGFVPSDYGVTINVPVSDPRYGRYPDIAKKRATYYREEKAKRPVNIRNIPHSRGGSIVGNYNKRYEYFLFVGRMENKFYYRDNSEASLYLPEPIKTDLPDTTHVMSLISRTPSSAGNVFGFHLNSMQPDNNILIGGTSGTPARGTFTVSGSSIPGTLAKGSFTVTGSSVTGSLASGSFVVAGATVAGTVAKGSFSVYRPPIYNVATGQFSVKSKDFVVNSNELRITSPGAINDFQINAAASGHQVSTGSTTSTPASITSFYNNLQTSIRSNTIYVNTDYTETTPNYGLGVYSGAKNTTNRMTGGFATDYWGKQGAWSAAFWIHVSSSVSQANTLLFYEKTSDLSDNGTAIGFVRRILYNSTDNQIQYERMYSASAPSPQVTIVTWAVSLDSPLQTDNWTHVTIRQHALAGTSGTNAIPDVRFQINGDEELDPSPTANGDFSDIYDIPATNRQYGLFSDGTIDSFYGGIDEFALWNVNLDVADPDVLYNNKLYAARTTMSSSNLKLWLRCGDSWTAGDSFEDPDNSKTFNSGDTLMDHTGLGSGGQRATVSMSSLGDIYLTDSIYESQGSALFTVKGNAQGTGSAYEGTISNVAGASFTIVDGTISSSVNTTNAVADGHTITVGGTTFELDMSGSGTSGGNTSVAFTNNQSASAFWNTLRTAIIDNTVYDTITYDVAAYDAHATFHITSSTTGASLNGDISNSGASFFSITQTAGGTDETGATDNDTLTINMASPKVFRLQNDGGSSADNDVTCGFGISNATFWNNLRSSIQTATSYTVSYSDNGNGTATFHLTSSVTGSDQNVTLAESGNSFSSLSNLEGGTNRSGSIDNHTLTINLSPAKTFRLQNDGGSSADNDVVCGPAISNVTFWNNLRSSIQTATGFSAITYTDNGNGTATFHITASAIGTSFNATLANSGGSFRNLNNLAGGTNDTDRAIDGHTIVIDGVTFELDKNSSVTDTSTLKGIDFGTSISSDNFWGSLSQSIKDNTVYDTIEVVNSDATQATFHLTSSTTGSALNVAITKTGASFYSLSGMAHGSDPVSAIRSSDTVLAIPGRNKDGDNTRSSETVIVSRFAAPGGIEIDSPAYLDVYFRERSVHNALPYRNLTVRGRSSGEATTIRMNTHLGTRDGLRTLLARHCGQFGIDSKHSAVSATNYSTAGSYHKQHRNTSKRYALSGTVGSISQTRVLVSRHDNASVTSPIPRSDFQYGWINASVSGSEGWRTNHNVVGYAPYGGIMQERKVLSTFANFSQNSSRINIGTAAKWDALIGASSTNKSMTFSAWINPRTGSGIRYILSFGGDVQLYINNGVILFKAKWNSASAIWNTSGDVFEYNKWSHVLVRYAATGTAQRPYIYVNGVDLGAPNQAGTTPSTVYDGIAGQDCFIGGIASNDFDGYIDSVTIGNSAMSIGAPPNAATVYALGRTGDPTSINASSLKLHYKLGDGFNPDDYLEKDSTSKFFDSSGNGNHSVSVTDVSIAEDETYEDTFPIVFPSASEIFGV